MIESVKPKLQFLPFYLLLLVFICLTIYLGVVTWNIQNSCYPMIGTLDMSMSDRCPKPCIPQPIPSPDMSMSDRCPPDPDPDPDPDPKPRYDPIPDIVGVLAGAGTMAGLAILGTTVFPVVAAGIGVWFLVRTTIKAISGS